MSERSDADLFAELPLDAQAKIINSFSKSDIEKLAFDWKFWARPKQLPPLGNWINWLVLAGRGFGKTRCGAEWVRAGMCGDTPLTGGRWRHVAIIGETAADVRGVMVGDGKATSDPTAGSGLLQIHPKDYLPEYQPSVRRLTWKNGAMATIYNGSEPDQLRGPQHDAAWLDELAKWQYQKDAYDQLCFGMRTGANPQKCITTTPQPTMLLKQIIGDPGTVITRGSTYENRSNLAGQFLADIKRKYEGTRLGRQEIDAEILEDLEGALWRRSDIDKARICEADLPVLRRIVVGIDPAASSGDDANESGIVACGVDERGHAYVLDDISGVYSPEQWAREAISLYDARHADRIVIEKNNGGEMCENTLRQVRSNVSCSMVWASRGKFVRAEPVSSLYEQGRIHHVGNFLKLEDQMCSMTVDFDRKAMGYSPDRVDALVWAIYALMIEGEPAKFRFV